MQLRQVRVRQRLRAAHVSLIQLCLALSAMHSNTLHAAKQ